MASPSLPSEPTSDVALARVPAGLVDSARAYAAASKAPRTADAYRRAWGAFVGWCDAHQLASLPAMPTTVALYLTARADAGRKPSTIALDLAAIAQAHRAAALPSPRPDAAVQAVVQGIRRSVGVAPTQKAPLLPSDLRTVVAALPTTRVGVRDRALLCLGFAGAFRRSELVALTVQDLAFTPDGLEVHLRRSKTDQEGEGRKIGVPYGGTPETCPVRTTRAWLDASGVASGPLFRPVTRHGRVGDGHLTPGSVARIVKRAVGRVGLDVARFSGHSLRAGLVTAAARAGKSEFAIQRQTGHRSVAMVRRYVRDANLFADNAAAGVGL